MHEARAGFTLIELITALFVLSVGLFGIIQMFHLGIGELVALDESMIAANAVQNEVEHLRALPFNAIQNAEAAPFHSAAPELDRLPEVEATVNVMDCPGTPHLKKVTVAVRWREKHGRIARKSATTLIADKGYRGL